MIVQGEGSHESKIYLLGEAPGSNEERLGRPFCGGAGRVLDGILSEVGIKRSDCFIDNVMQVRPKGNDFGKYYTDKARRQPVQSLIEGQARIRGLVLQHRPNVVVCLGNESLSAICRTKGIMHWRGSILDFEGVKVIPTIHPAMVMRQFEFHPISVLDFTRIKRESATPKFPTPYQDSFIINPSFEQVMYYLTEFLPKQPIITFDIETGGKQIICMGFGWSKQDAICIPMFFSSSSWWKSAAEEVAIVQAINKLFANPNIKFIAQNAQFDMTYIKDLWSSNVTNLWMDTMIAFHCTYPELKKGLDFLSSIYTNRPYHKGMVGKKGVAKGATPENLWKYNCLDCVVTYECAMEIQREMKEFGTHEFYYSHSHNLIKPLMEMQRRGVRIDVKKREEIDKNLTKDQADLQERLTKAVGHELNVASPKQMKDFIYNELKMPPQVNRKTGNVTTDADAIESLAKKFPNPAFSLILDIRKIRKILSTYIKAPIDGDERIRCSYVITGTETGRLSSRESVYGSGTNLQNIPRGDLVRGIFIPDNGCCFVNVDLSQAEARATAYLAEEQQMIMFFEEGRDIHSVNAAMAYNKKESDVTKLERQTAKPYAHGANYMIGARQLGKVLGVPEDRARDLIFRYYAYYPSIKLWHRAVEDQLRKTRVLTTPLGRKRMFFGRWSQELTREGVAYIPQSLVGDILNWGIIRCWSALPQGWEILLQVHDSVLVQVPLGTDPMHIYKFFKHYFEIPVEINHRTMVIPVDFKVGMSWGNMHDMEIPK